jgi:hypothetical protein
MRRLWVPEWLKAPHRGLRVYQFAVALALLFLLQLVLVNVLLFSGALGQLLSRSTGVVHVETGRSFSWWPGVVQLRELRLEVTDSNVHLELLVPAGRANISLRELLLRRFATASVTGQHFVLRVRPKFAALSAARTAALPPLSEPVSKPSTGKQPYLWPVRIAGLDAQFDELWVSELRYRGDARVQGGFELKPQERVSVDPSDVRLQGGTLTYGAEQPLLELRDARVQAELRETSVDALLQAWRRNLSARVELDGSVADLAFLSNLFPELEGLSDGRGELQLRAAAERGEWIGGFDLEYAAPRVAYANGPWQGTLALTLAAHTEDVEALPATLRLRELALELQGRQLAALERAQLGLELTRAFPIVASQAVELELHGLRLQGLEALPRALRPGRWRPSSLSVPRLHAALTWREGAASGSADLQFRDFEGSYRGWSLQQSGALVLRGVHWKGPGHKLRASGLALDLERVRLRHESTDIDDWKLRLELSELAYAPLARRLTAGVLAAAADARPVLSLLGVPSPPPGVYDVLAMPDLKVRGRLDLSPEQQDITLERAESKTIDVRGRWLRDGEQAHAALLFQAAPLSLGVEVAPSGTSVKLFASEDWLRSRLQRLAPAAPAPAGD